MGIFSRIGKWLKPVRKDGPGDGDDLAEALAWVMAGAGAKVRRLPGDEKWLLPAIRRALLHVEAIVHRTAGPVDVRRNRWDADPILNAVFPSAEVLAKGLDGSVHLKRFFLESPADQAYGLLTMRRTEKTVMTVEMEGGILKRDVARTAVGFDDHEIRFLFPTEAETRREMVRYGMSYLGAAARDRIAGIEDWIADLETRRYVLEKEIQFAESEKDPGERHTPQGRQEAERIVEGRSVLGEIDAKLAELGGQVASPEEYIHRLIEVLEARETYLDLRTVYLYLDAMNLKVRPQSAGDARHVAFTEILLDGGRRAVGVIVRVPRGEVPDGTGREPQQAGKA